MKRKPTVQQPIDIFILKMSEYSNFSYEVLKKFDDSVREEYSKRSVLCLNKEKQ